MILHSLDRYREEGLLILRLGIGAMFMGHGIPKLLGGPELWAKVGGALSTFGIDVAPALFGLMAGLSEAGGGLLLALGLLTRPACFLLLCTMTVATGMHIGRGDSFGTASHALEAAILFFSLLFIGPGRLSLDEKLSRKKKMA